MEWYRVVKTINGRRYLYWQKTYRVGRSVKTLNKYIGPATGAVSAFAPPASGSSFFPDSEKYALGQTLEHKHADFHKLAPLKALHDAEYSRINAMPQGSPERGTEIDAFYARAGKNYLDLKNKIRLDCIALAESQLLSNRQVRGWSRAAWHRSEIDPRR